MAPGPGHRGLPCPSRALDSARPVHIPPGYCTSTGPVAACMREGPPSGRGVGLAASLDRWVDEVGVGNWRVGHPRYPTLDRGGRAWPAWGPGPTHLPATMLTSQAPSQLPPSGQWSPGTPCLCLLGASHPGGGASWAQAPQGAAPWACGLASSHLPRSSPPSWVPESPGSSVWGAGLLKSGTSSGERRAATGTWDGNLGREGGPKHLDSPRDPGSHLEDNVPGLLMVATH